MSTCKAEKPKDALTITGLNGKRERMVDAGETEAETVIRLKVNTCPIGVVFADLRIKFERALRVKPEEPQATGRIF